MSARSLVTIARDTARCGGASQTGETSISDVAWHVLRVARPDPALYGWRFDCGPDRNQLSGRPDRGGHPAYKVKQFSHRCFAEVPMAESVHDGVSVPLQVGQFLVLRP